MLGTSCSSIASTAANAGDTTRRDAPRVGVGLKNQRKDEKAGGPQRAAGAHWGVRRSVTHKQLFGSACEPLWATCDAFCHLTPSHLHENTNSIEYQFFGPFCTFLTRVAITAPRRPKRTKPGSKAVWVLGNQPVAGFARRFGRLARQHVRCGAHMCPFQGQKSALGARSNTRAQPRSTANIRAQTML